MNTPMYLYSVSRKEVAPSEMASCKSAAFWTICTGTRNQACTLIQRLSKLLYCASYCLTHETASRCSADLKA